MSDCRGCRDHFRRSRRRALQIRLSVTPDGDRIGAQSLPGPSSEVVDIVLEESAKQKISLKIYPLLGQQLLSDSDSS